MSAKNSVVNEVGSRKISKGTRVSLQSRLKSSNDNPSMNKKPIERHSSNIEGISDDETDSLLYMAYDDPIGEMSGSRIARLSKGSRL